MSLLGTILIIILILALLGVYPGMGFVPGYGPFGIVGVILLLLIILALMGRI